MATRRNFLKVFSAAASAIFAGVGGCIAAAAVDAAPSVSPREGEELDGKYFDVLDYVYERTGHFNSELRFDRGALFADGDDHTILLTKGCVTTCQPYDLYRHRRTNEVRYVTHPTSTRLNVERLVARTDGFKRMCDLFEIRNQAKATLLVGDKRFALGPCLVTAVGVGASSEAPGFTVASDVEFCVGKLEQLAEVAARHVTQDWPNTVEFLPAKFNA